MAFVSGLVTGLFIGAFIGLVTMAVLTMASDADERGGRE